MKVKLKDEQYRELTELAVYLYDNYPSIVKKYFKLSRLKAEENQKEPNKKEKLAEVLGYSYKAVFEVEKTGVSNKKLDNIKSQYQLLEKEKPNAKDKKYIDRCTLLISQLLEKNTAEPDSALRWFANSNWYIYERKPETIERKFITFKGIDVTFKGTERLEKIQVEVYVAEAGMVHWEGEAHLDTAGEFLVISTYNKSSKRSLPTFYMVRINSQGTDASLCIGLEMSASKINHNSVSKSIVLEKTNEEKPATQEWRMIDLEARRTEKKPLPMSEPVYKYLYDRKRNRLSSPHQMIITSLDLLEKWQEQNRDKKKELKGNFFTGKYTVYYQRKSGEDPNEDKLEITDFFNELHTEYLHYFDGTNSEPWSGTARYSDGSKALFISLERGSNEKEESINSIFLILNVPSLRNLEVATGIISGIRDSYDGAIGMNVVAIKQPETAEQEAKDKELVKNFFQGKECHSINTPPVRIATRDDFKKAFG